MSANRPSPTESGRGRRHLTKFPAFLFRLVSQLPVSLSSSPPPSHMPDQHRTHRNSWHADAARDRPAPSYRRSPSPRVRGGGRYDEVRGPRPRTASPHGRRRSPVPSQPSTPWSYDGGVDHLLRGSESTSTTANQANGKLRAVTTSSRKRTYCLGPVNHRLDTGGHSKLVTVICGHAVNIDL